MADFVFNVAKGRVAELYNRVDSNDPANSALIVMVLATSGLESDATLRDKTTFSDLVSGATNEVTNAGYARLVLTDTDLAAMAADQANDRMDLDTADLAFGAITAGDGWSKIVIGYDSDTTAGTDANIIPLTCHDFVITPDGSTVTALVTNFFRAS
jgi:hypothetical protein